VKTESVYEDLIENSTILGLNKDKVKSIQEEMMVKKKRLNTSKRKKYTEYYSAESIHLIAKKDKWLLERYDYSFK